MRSQAHRSRFISLALLLAVASVFLFAPTTVATIIGGSVTGGGGTFIKLEVPFTDSDPDNTVGDNTFQNPNLYGFDEDQNILLVEDVIVDIGTSPIVIGEMVASHYIMFDPEFTTLITGTVDFDSEVIAIITSTGLLLASDFLANTGVTYLNPALRGLEGGSDSVSISGLQQISLAWIASTPGDYIRVLTQFSPAAFPIQEPTTLALFGTGMLGRSVLRDGGRN